MLGGTVFADEHSAGYMLGTLFADVVIIGIPVLLLYVGWRRERQGRRADAWYVIGGVLLAVVAMSFLGRLIT